MWIVSSTELWLHDTHFTIQYKSSTSLQTSGLFLWQQIPATTNIRITIYLMITYYCTVVATVDCTCLMPCLPATGLYTPAQSAVGVVMTYSPLAFGPPAPRHAGRESQVCAACRLAGQTARRLLHWNQNSAAPSCDVIMHHTSARKYTD